MVEVTIFLGFNNGEVYKLDGWVVAEHRAHHYTNKYQGDELDPAEFFESELDYALNNVTELLDWLKNSMDYDDFQEHLELVEYEQVCDYKYEWKNGNVSTSVKTESSS